MEILLAESMSYFVLGGAGKATPGGLMKGLAQRGTLALNNSAAAVGRV